MKSCGMVRRLDDLGRIVLPKELRRTRNIEEGDPMEIFVEGNHIILKAYKPGCNFCGDLDCKDIMGSRICKACAEKAVTLYK